VWQLEAEGYPLAMKKKMSEMTQWLSEDAIWTSVRWYVFKLQLNPAA
jgi:hypothetical protein